MALRASVAAGRRHSAVHCHIGDDMTLRMQREGARTGDVTATLVWNSTHDLDLHVICPDGTVNTLTTAEAKLLTVLLERPRAVIGRDELLELSAGRVAGPFDRTIDNQVSRLRRKIEPDVLRPRIISTVRNGGYCLNCDVEVEA